MDAASVRCPQCGRRLFDISPDRPAHGSITIRGPRCRGFTKVDLSIYNQEEGKQTASASERLTASEPNQAPSERH